MNATFLDSLRLSRKSTAGRARVSGKDGVRFVELTDAVVRVRVAGSGPRTIVFAPDPPNVIEHYAPLIRALGKDLRVVCFELPGFGHSIPRRGYRFTFEENARLIAELIERLEVAPVVLALSCVAGLMAVKVAREHRALVSHVIALQTPSLSEELRWAARVDKQRLVRTPVVGQLLLAVAHRRLAHGWYQAALGDQSPLADYEPLALESFDRGASFSLASGLQALERTQEPAFGPVLQPSLVVWGTRDRTHRRTDRRSTLAYLPGAAIVELDNAGHFPDLEQPERFRAEVLRFLAERPGG